MYSCHIEHDFTSDTIKVWFFQRVRLRDSALIAQFVSNDRWTMREISQGSPWGEPSLTLHPTMIEQLVAKSQDILPPSAAVDRHLKDAITVRDRLLALVERT